MKSTTSSSSCMTRCADVETASGAVTRRDARVTRVESRASRSSLEREEDRLEFATYRACGASFDRVDLFYICHVAYEQKR